MSEPTGQGADAKLQPAGGELQLCVRLPAIQRRRFAVMCQEMGMSQQEVVSTMIAATLHEYYVASKLAGDE